MNNSDTWESVRLRIEQATREMLTQTIPEVLNKPTLYESLCEKYEAGSRIHDNEWMDWGPERFYENAEEEILDCVLYLAMNIVRQEHAKMYGCSNSTPYNEVEPCRDFD